jgi:hypothetical protein
VFGSLGIAGLAGALSESTRSILFYGALALYVGLTCYNAYQALRFNSFLPIVLNLTVALLKQLLTILIALFSLLQLSRVFSDTNTRSDKALGGFFLLGALTLLVSCVNGDEVAEHRETGLISEV